MLEWRARAEVGGHHLVPVRVRLALADALRIFADRLWACVNDPAAPIVPLNQDELARVRDYEHQSPAAGLQSLQWSTQIFMQAIDGIDPATPYRHPVLGDGTVLDGLRTAAHEVQHHELDVRRGITA